MALVVDPARAALQDDLEERMTRDEIAEAETLARRCLTSHYEDCDRN